MVGDCDDNDDGAKVSYLGSECLLSMHLVQLGCSHTQATAGL